RGQTSVADNAAAVEAPCRRAIFAGHRGSGNADRLVVKRVLLVFTVSVVSTLLAFAAVEGYLRATGYRPWRQLRDNTFEPILHDPDTELGWVLRPGHWRYGPYAPGGPRVEVTISSDRARRTQDDGDPLPAPRRRVLLLGCSFTFGWAVSDDETWAWG